MTQKRHLKIIDPTAMWPARDDHRPIPTLDPTDWSLVLKCPSCDGTNIHQTYTRTIFREEDGSGLEVFATTDDAKAKHIDSTMIPGRRDILHIGFECGNPMCPPCRLVVQQHKDRTHLYWEFPEPDEREPRA